jgi:dTDP-4-dehydrorhamnose 3,5-epimerase
MKLTETSLAGAFLIEPEKHADSRGFFARAWCARELADHSLPGQFVQSNISRNNRKGTLRGLHYQAEPFGEAKLMRCGRGSLFAAIVDIRPGSRTFLQHTSAVLTSENLLTLYVPEGFANGFQTLEDDTEVVYHMTQFYSPEHSRGIRWCDPTLNIPWPPGDRTISERDQALPFVSQISDGF